MSKTWLACKISRPVKFGKFGACWLGWQPKNVIICEFYVKTQKCRLPTAALYTALAGNFSIG
jgi:hypothetical protein